MKTSASAPHLSNPMTNDLSSALNEETPIAINDENTDEDSTDEQG